MRAELTRYVAPGWGVGELWCSDTLVLAHELRFGADAHAAEEDVLAPPKGGRDAPSGTLSTNPQRVGNGFVARSQLQSAGARDGRSRAESRPTPPTSASREATALASSRRLDVVELVERFRAYLDGADVLLDDVPIDLGWATPFQRAVAAQLRRIPRGEVVSYGELAALAGYPGAARAAGTFCARNRFMLILPCHRIVGASDIGGYGSAGVEVKRRLLAREGVVL